VDVRANGERARRVLLGRFAIGCLFDEAGCSTSRRRSTEECDSWAGVVELSMFDTFNQGFNEERREVPWFGVHF